MTSQYQPKLTTIIVSPSDVPWVAPTIKILRDPVVLFAVVDVRWLAVAIVTGLVPVLALGLVGRHKTKLAIIG